MKLFFVSLLMFAVLIASGQKKVVFGDVFKNQTLRVDYIFAGDANHQAIYLDAMSYQEHWAGRRVNLSSVPFSGNGQIRMYKPGTKEVVYMISFSTLFNEWLATDEAQHVARSFENSFLLPMPEKPMDVEVVLMDSYHKVIAKFTHRVDPKDILIQKRSRVLENGTQVKRVHTGGMPDKCIDIAILSEGYAANEADKFWKDAETAKTAILSHEPFKSLAKKFNFNAVFVPSINSGVSVPRLGEWKNTAVGSHFSTFYSDRYLTSLNIKQIHNCLSCVDYEHIIILANTPEYGGGGIYNSYTLTSSGHSQFKPVVVHEFGHSFGGLGDEYYYTTEADTTTYPASAEPWEPNLTTLVEKPCKWAHMMDEDIRGEIGKVGANGVGILEGGGYSGKLIYSPSKDCRMKTNEYPKFCPVCEEAIRKVILYHVQER